MTPFEFDILLHYYAHADDHNVIIDNPPIWRETRQMFLDEALLRENPGIVVCYTITERGKFYIDDALSTPLPVWASGRTVKQGD